MGIKIRFIIYLIAMNLCILPVCAVNYIDFGGLAIDYDSVKNHKKFISFDILSNNAVFSNEYYKKTNTMCVRKVYDINKPKDIERCKIDNDSCTALDNYDLRDFLYTVCNEKANKKEKDLNFLGQNFSNLMKTLADLTYAVITAFY